MIVLDSDILRKARELIATKKQNRLCYAISHAASLYHSEGQGWSLRDWVMNSLQGCAVYEEWIEAKYPDIAWRHKLTSFNHETVLRAGRLAWLDWMIAECEKKEGEPK